MEELPRSGTIVKGVGGFYYGRDAAGEVYTLRAKGIFRKRHLTPMVGDHILFTPGSGEEHGWIEEILPRESMLIRPPVANIRHLLIVLAPQPQPDPLMLDMLLILAFRQGIAPAIAVNKCDLGEELYQQIAREYAALNIPVLKVSAAREEGLEELRALLREGIVCLAGQSGVGKSTLVSAATDLHLETGAISEKIHRGRHTTRHVELLFQGDYCVLDTPGFSLLELWEGLEPITLKDYYPEFAEYEGLCRFQPCYHLSEPGCAVLAAAQRGEIHPARLERYHQILKNVQEAWKKRYD